jgi:hypothetical protein
MDTVRVHVSLALGNLTCLCGLGIHMLLSLRRSWPEVVHRVGTIGHVSTAVPLD